MRRVAMITAILLIANLSVQPVDFYTRVIHKLCEMTNTPVPTKIEIEVMTADQMVSMYRKDAYAECVMYGNDPAYCAMRVSAVRIFVFGRWQREKDPMYLHIYMYKDGGLKVLLHEFSHWRLSILSSPMGVLNTDEMAEEMATRIILSDEFQDWLKKEEK